MNFKNLAFCEDGLPYLGCSIRSLNDSPGMELVLVNSDSPAWHAGLKLGDILLEIDHKTVNNIDDYRKCLANALSDQMKARNGIELKIIRRGQVKTLLLQFNL